MFEALSVFFSARFLCLGRFRAFYAQPAGGGSDGRARAKLQQVTSKYLSALSHLNVP